MGLRHKNLEAAGSSDRHLAAYITGSTYSSSRHRQRVGDFGSFTHIISIQTALFFQLPHPHLSVLQWPPHCPLALSPRSHLRPYPPGHHWLVGSVTWQFKVPRALSVTIICHTSMAIGINQEKLEQNIGFFPLMPVPSLIPQIGSVNVMAQEFAFLKGAPLISIHVVLKITLSGKQCSKAVDMKLFYSCA